MLLCRDLAHQAAAPPCTSLEAGVSSFDALRSQCLRTSAKMVKAVPLSNLAYPVPGAWQALRDSVILPALDQDHVLIVDVSDTSSTALQVWPASVLQQVQARPCMSALWRHQPKCRANDT